MKFIFVIDLTDTRTFANFNWMDLLYCREGKCVQYEMTYEYYRDMIILFPLGKLKAKNLRTAARQVTTR